MLTILVTMGVVSWLVVAVPRLVDYGIAFDDQWNTLAQRESRIRERCSSLS